MVLPLSLLDLLEEARIRPLLSKAGLGQEAVLRLAQSFQDVGKGIWQLGVEEAASVYAAFVPGRIEVLGKHTDYAGGSSLVCAVEDGFCMVAAPRTDRRLNIVDVVQEARVAFELVPDVARQSGDWSNYLKTVARRVARNFEGPLVGADVAFASTLPGAAGMSSSSAMMIAFFLMLHACNGLEVHPAYTDNIGSKEELAQYLGTIENGSSFKALTGDTGVGTFGGSQDHTAILCARTGMLTQFAYAPTRFERTVAMPKNMTFVIAASGVEANKTGNARAAYNRASALATGIIAVWCRETGESPFHLGELLVNTDQPLDAIRTVLSRTKNAKYDAQELLARFEHFVLESRRILPAAMTALEEGDLEGFGRQASVSQVGAERLLQNQVPETSFLAREARKLGATAASAFGAGFGGSVWALVEKEEVPGFIPGWKEAYTTAFPEPARRARFFRAHPGPAAFYLQD